MVFELTTELLVNFSLILIAISILIIIVSLFIISRKSQEEKSISEVISLLKNIKKEDNVVQKNIEFSIHSGEVSLKDRLKKKFQPKIESQLKTKVEMLDFNAQDKNFLALISISGLKILLTLDSSGKIIDYKKILPS
jgi:thioredoxin-related protein